MKALISWLPDMDLNHDKQIQSLLCYRYTIGQTGASKVEGWSAESRLPKVEKQDLLTYFTNPSIQKTSYLKAC